MWLTLERLDRNDLPQPRYQTLQSAGLDFAACLTRPCFLVEPGSGVKREFKVDGEYWSWKDTGLVLSDPFTGQKSKATQDYETLADRDAVLVIHPGETVMIPLGFKSSFSTMAHLQIHVRSSTGLRGLVLANGTGIVDADYRGELFAVVRNVSPVPVRVKHGERIVQGILTHSSQAIIKEGPVDETERGTGGFGSTGVSNVTRQPEPAGCPHNG
jgi:deoxyuridine 5'-triphosphate nucleotidohydrolase